MIFQVPKLFSCCNKLLFFLSKFGYQSFLRFLLVVQFIQLAAPFQLPGRLCVSHLHEMPRDVNVFLGQVAQSAPLRIDCSLDKAR